MCKVRQILKFQVQILQTLCIVTYSIYELLNSNIIKIIYGTIAKILVNIKNH